MTDGVLTLEVVVVAVVGRTASRVVVAGVVVTSGLPTRREVFVVERSSLVVAGVVVTSG